MKKNVSSFALKRLLGYLKPQAVFVVLSFLFSAGIVAGTLYLPILTGQAVDHIVGAGDVDFTGIKAVILRMIVVIAATAVCQWLVNVINTSISMKTAKKLRIEVFEKILQLPVSYLDSHPHGDLLSRAIVDIEQISDGILLGATQLFTGVLTILVTLVIMLRIDPLVTLLVAVLTPLSFLIARFVAKHSKEMFDKQSKSRGSVTAYTNEMLENIKVVKAFGYGERACVEFEKRNDQLKAHSMKATFYSSLVNPSTRLIYSMIYAVVAAFGGFSVIRGGMSVGTLVAFLGYTNQYSKPFNEITGVVAEFQNALAGAKRVFELLDEKPTSDEGMVKDFPAACRNITLEDVEFAYVPENPLIREFNLTVPAGKKAAIVGPTGCGKTTIINLIMRFYDINSGKIRLDDTDTSSLKKNTLRRQFAMVLQDTWLKTDTIRNNIAYGKPDASMEEIVHAAKEASADGFIRKLPDGYDTVIMEGGNLSAGERQLICIARVMLDPPSMLILDEATSSIDSLTELHITKDFDKIMEGRTSIVVAHRLSTIKEADIIIAMKDGRILESGTHEELLKKGGFYSEIYHSQFRRE